MPACFQLTRIGEKEPEPLVSIDAAMCWHFRQPCDDDRYFKWWFDTIGSYLAYGKTWDEIHEILKENMFKFAAEDKAEIGRVQAGQIAASEWQILILKWLRTNYTYDSWYQVGRR